MTAEERARELMGATTLPDHFKLRDGKPFRWALQEALASARRDALMEAAEVARKAHHKSIRYARRLRCVKRPEVAEEVEAMAVAEEAIAIAIEALAKDTPEG